MAALLAACLVSSLAWGRDGTSVFQEDTSVFETMKRHKQLTNITNLFVAAELVPTLNGSDLVTLFAPDDAAFALQGTAKMDHWLDPKNRNELRSLLLLHSFFGDILSTALGPSQSLQSSIRGGEQSSGHTELYQCHPLRKYHGHRERHYGTTERRS